MSDYRGVVFNGPILSRRIYICLKAVFFFSFFRVLCTYVRLDDDDAAAGPREGALAAMATPDAAFPGGEREPGIRNENCGVVFDLLFGAILSDFFLHVCGFVAK